MNPKVLRIILKQNLNCYWTRAVDMSLERISSIDLRAFDAQTTTDIETCVVIPAGVFVQRKGYLGKLIPWNNIDDLDIAGTAPGFEPVETGMQNEGSTSVPPANLPGAKAPNPAMPNQPGLPSGKK